MAYELSLPRFMWQDTDTGERSAAATRTGRTIRKAFDEQFNGGVSDWTGETGV